MRTLIIILSFILCSTINAQNKRIAVSCDGNIHDRDDICSVSIELGIIAKSNLQSQVTYFGYNDHYWQTTTSQQTDETNSVINSANSWGGFNMSKFIDVQKNHTTAVNMLVAEINKSSATDLLTIAALGPMQVVGEAIAQSNAGNRQYVTVVSHSDWNNTHAGNTGASEGLSLPRYNLDATNNTGSGTTFISNLGVKITKIKDQNNTVSAPYTSYTWLQNSTDSRLKLMWTECRTVANKSNFDCSDAGVLWYIIKNDENGSPAKLQTFFASDVVVTPPTIPSTSGVYYISSSDGDDNNAGNSPGSAWRTLNRLNSSWGSIQPGNQVLLKRGDVFSGFIVVGKSGGPISKITIGAYGTGAKPAITGLTTVSGWVSKGNGVYESTTTTPVDLMTVLINGKTYGQGRSPNAGSYYTATSNSTGSTTTNVTGSGMNGTNWTGATIVGRTAHWIMERFRITSQSGNTITYTNGNTTTPRTIGTGNGFFIMNDIRTLDQFGEWYRNPSTGRLSVYFGTNAPSSYTVEMSIAKNLIAAASKTNVTIQSLVLKGSNGNAIDISYGSGISVIDCDIDASGGDGVMIVNHSNGTVSGSSITRSLNNGIEANHFSAGPNTTITNNYVDYAYYIEGMGGNSQQDGMGISLFNTGVVQGNIIMHTGYCGIFFWYLPVTIKNNYISNFCFIKDDGGGIYTGGNTGKPSGLKKTLVGNIVLNGIGAPQGTTSTGSVAEGIYMDDQANTIDILNNTVAFAGKGLYIHNNKNITVTGNTFFDNNIGMFYKVNGAGNAITGLDVARNISFALTPAQRTVYLANTTGGSAAGFGVIDNNYYCKPIVESLSASLAPVRHLTWREGSGDNTVTLAGWQSKYPNYDAHSSKTVKTIANQNEALFQYNPTGSTATVDLRTNKYVDVAGVVYQGQLQLAPFTSKILLLTDGIPFTPPPISPQVPGTGPDVPPVTPPDVPPVIPDPPGLKRAKTKFIIVTPNP